jgi:transposase
VEYGPRFRERLVEQMMSPHAKSQSALAKEVGVPQPTLSRWLREAKLRGMPKDNKRRPAKRWTPEEKLRVVLDAAAAGEAGLGALLRREGLHEADLTRFRTEVQQAALDGLRTKSARPGSSAEDKRVKALEKELRRKEKALAEAAALLVLRKKAQALFGEEEGDDTSDENEK